MQSAEKKKPIDGGELPIVSVIMPVFNAAAFLGQAVKSVQQQSFQNWELLVVDDASTDGSFEIASDFSKTDSRIRTTKLPENKGTAHCRNRATENAQGTYIAFLDADDLWQPEKLEKQLQFMHAKNCAVSFTNYLLIDHNGNSLRKKINALPSLSFKKQRRNNYIGNLTGMYNAGVLGKIYSPELRKRQDWALWLEAIKRSGKPALGLNEDLAFYRVHKNSISTNKWGLVKHNFLFYRKHLKYSPPVSIYFLLLFFWEYFFVRPKQIENL